MCIKRLSCQYHIAFDIQCLKTYTSNNSVYFSVHIFTEVCGAVQLNNVSLLKKNSYFYISIPKRKPMPGGAGGSITAMILSLKNNKALLRKRKNFRDLRAEQVAELDKRKLSFKHADEKYLKELRQDLLREHKRVMIALYFKLGLVLTIIFLLIAGIFILIPKTTNHKEPVRTARNHDDTVRMFASAYKYMIRYGEYRYNAKEYKEAIHELNQALELFPGDYHASLLLSKVYTAMCKEEDTLCNDAIATLNFVIAKNDTSVEALEVRANLLIHLGDFTSASNDFDKISLLQNNP